MEHVTWNEQNFNGKVLSVKNSKQGTKLIKLFHFGQWKKLKMIEKMNI